MNRDSRLLDFQARERRTFAMLQTTKLVLALALTVLPVNTVFAQSVTINGRPIVTNPRQQINSDQANRIFGGLNSAVHALPPAGQPAFLAGNPIVVQQKQAAVQASRYFSEASPIGTALDGSVGNTRGAMQGWIVSGNSPNVRLRPLSPAEYEWLFGGLKDAVPSSPPPR
jgi:hypothetical protein